MIESRTYFALTFTSCLLLYMGTPLLPETRFGVLLGAAGVSVFAFLFIGRAARDLQMKPPANALLWGAAVISVLGVYGLNRSLTNFETIPPFEGNVFFIENADRVMFAEKTGEDSGDYRILSTYPKKGWLPKTFSINVLLLTAGLSLGVLLGRQVEKASHIFAIIVLGAVMDVWSVTAGVTEQISASPHTSYYFLFNWPLAGRGGVTYPLLGSTDFFFITLFLFLAWKFGLPPLRNLLGMAGAVAGAILSALVLQRGVPALPFIGAAVLVLNFREIRPDRKELLQIIAGAAVILAIFALLWR